MYNLKKQQLFIIKIEKLISNVDITKIISHSEYQNMKNIYDGYPLAKSFLPTSNIQIIVEDLQLAINDLSITDNIKAINNIPELIFLDIAFSNNKINMSDKDVYITLIEDEEYNIEHNYIRNYLFNFIRYVDSDNHSIDYKPLYSKLNQIINDNNLRMSNIFPGAKLSPLNTIFGLTDKTYNSVDSVTKSKKVSYKIECICGAKYTVSEKNIKNMVEIDEKSQNIIFNCNHSGSNKIAGKFFIKRDEHSFFKSNPDDSTIRTWFMQNFKSFVKADDVTK